MYRTVGLSHTLPVFDAHEDDRRFFETEGIAILTMLISQYKVEIKEEPQYAGETFELVFSDEFNVDGRTFYPGDDP